MLHEVLLKVLKVAIGTILTMLLGSVWFSDSLFGIQYKKLCGITEAQQRRHNQGMGVSLLIESVAKLAKTVVFFFIVNTFDKSFSTAFQLSCWIFVGFVLPQIASKVAWELKNWDYFIINATEGFISLIVLSFISTF